MTTRGPRERGDEPSEHWIMPSSEVDIAEVRAFWELNPLAAAAIEAQPGTPQFYARFGDLREAVEPSSFQEVFYRYPLYAGKRVLDVGCGNGYLLSRYRKAGARTVGLDLTARAVSLSARRFELEGLRGDFVEANAEDLPFSEGVFDLVLSMGVLHHTPRTGRAVAEIHRVLKPGGVFLIMLYHKNSLAYRFAFALGRFLKPAFFGKSMQEMVNRVDGERNPIGKVHSRSDLARLLSAFNEVEMLVRCLEPSHFGKKAIGNLVPAPAREWLSRYWGWFLYARAVKPAGAVS
jgi:SAM-dependent methyltransferase